jgi:hypothetical protein
MSFPLFGPEMQRFQKHLLAGKRALNTGGATGLGKSMPALPRAESGSIMNFEEGV